MSSILPTILLGAAGVLFLIAGILTVRSFRSTNEPQGWILFLLANLFLAGWAGYRAYLLTLSEPALWINEVVIGGLATAAAALDCAVVTILGNQALKSQKRQKSLTEDAQRYLMSLDKAPQFIMIKDRQGTYQYANDAFVQFLGKKDHHLIGETDFKFLPRAQANAFRAEEEKAMESGSVRTRDEEIRGIDGLHWLRTSRIPLLDEQHHFEALLVTGVDITAQKQAEIVLQTMQADLAALVDAGQSLGAPGTQETAWEQVIIWAGKIAGTEHVAVWQISPERSVAVVKAGCGKFANLVNFQLRAGEDMPWKVWQSGTAELLNDYANWPGRSPRLRDTNFCAALGLPIRLKDQVAYAMTAYLDEPGILFRDDQVQLLKVFFENVSAHLEHQERSTAFQSEIEDWKRKQEALQYRLRLEHILAVIAAHFINPDLEKIDEGITRSLQTIARFAGIERAYLILLPRKLGAASSEPGWYGSGVGADILAESQREEFQWYLSKVNQLEAVHLPRVKDLAIDQEEAAAYLRLRGMKSFTVVPLSSNRAAIGYLGFESLRAEMEWSPEILGLWKTSAELFAGLLERKWAAKDTQELLDQANAQITALELRNQEGALLSEMGDLLQASRTSDEAYPIIVRYLKRLIPAASGALYMIHDPKDPAEQVATWGSAQPGAAEHELILNECWSLRRGRLYSVQDPSTEPVCGHIKEPLETGYMCVPLIAQGLAVGVLHLRLPNGQVGERKFTEGQQRLAAKIGEYIAVPLTNLKLRDELRSQAIRDPLTRLFNRRYMEETLDREIRRASRHATSVGIIMFDIDKMKPINDRFGHDAGDLVLKTLGRELQGMFRGEDVACRYGGDEFTIVLPEASLADVWRRAEQMRATIKSLDLRYDGKQLGALTLSIGVAAYPDHGITAEKVLLASDAASYASKSEGGDRIMMGHRAEG